MKPIEWSAMEALLFEKFSREADIWSYGVLVWEVFSKGEHPYSFLSNKAEIVEYLKQGKRLSQPSLSDSELYQLMAQCWKESPSQR